jgi:hypothetical protein
VRATEVAPAAPGPHAKTPFCAYNPGHSKGLSMIDVIAAAIAAGAVAGLTDAAKQTIGDAYATLKARLSARFGKAASAVAALEDDPQDEDSQKLLAKRLDDTGAAADPDVQADVARLTAALKAAGITPGVTQTASGTGNVQIAGSGNTLTSNVSTGNTGINLQGSTVSGDVIQGDKVAGDKIDRQSNTGGAYIAGNVSAGGDVIGRDKIEHHYHSTAPQLSEIVSADARALVPLLNQYFSLSDIDGLCFEMGIDDEQLRGQTKDEKARSLVKFVEQSGRLDELKRLMRVARPNLRDRLA